MESQKWVKVGKVMGDTQCGVPGLEPGKRYKFRVKAVNSEGESEPLVADSDILAKDPYGLSLVNHHVNCTSFVVRITRRKVTITICGCTI